MDGVPEEVDEVEENQLGALLLLDPDHLAVQVADEGVGDVEEMDGDVIALLDVSAQLGEDFLESTRGRAVRWHGIRIS